MKNMNFVKALTSEHVSNIWAKFRSSPINLDTLLSRLSGGNTQKNKTRLLGTELRFPHFSHLIKADVNAVIPPTNRTQRGSPQKSFVTKQCISQAVRTKTQHLFPQFVVYRLAISLHSKHLGESKTRSLHFLHSPQFSHGQKANNASNEQKKPTETLATQAISRSTTVKMFSSSLEPSSDELVLVEESTDFALTGVSTCRERVNLLSTSLVLAPILSHTQVEVDGSGSSKSATAWLDQEPLLLAANTHFFLLLMVVFA